MAARPGDRHVLRHLLPAGLDGRVRTAFADGTSVTGDLLVGADGVGSAVRGMLAPEVTPTDTGVRVAIGRTPLTERSARPVPGFGTARRDADLLRDLTEVA